MEINRAKTQQILNQRGCFPISNRAFEVLVLDFKNSASNLTYDDVCLSSKESIIGTKNERL